MTKLQKKDKQKSAAKSSYLSVTYDENVAPISAYPLQLASFITTNFFSKKGKLLDVGCGTGEFLKAFSCQGFDSIGVDLSPNINQLKEFDVRNCDFEEDQLPYEDGSIDFIFSKSVIEHLHAPEGLIDECYRVLKPGGRAVIMCPSWKHNYKEAFYIDHTHVTPFTRLSLEQILKQSGFNVIKCDHFMQLPSAWGNKLVSALYNIFSLLPLPYSPINRISWPNSFNKLIRFSKEKMLLSVVEKV